MNKPHVNREQVKQALETMVADNAYQKVFKFDEKVGGFLYECSYYSIGADSCDSEYMVIKKYLLEEQRKLMGWNK